MSDVQDTLQNCINYVHEWCTLNRLYMNMKKIKIMWFGVSNITDDAMSDTICIAGSMIERVYTYPYLGIELDSVLSFDKHLDNVVSKCSQKLYIFQKVRRFISVDTAVLIYEQTIRPLRHLRTHPLLVE